MPSTVLAANAVPSISIELGAAVTWLLGALVVLFGIIAWFLRREITRNDEAHRELRADIKVVETDVKKLLAGDVPWVAAINSRFAAIDARLATIDSRFAAIDSKLAGLGELMSRRAPAAGNEQRSE